jgi:hypothetical protein
MTRLYSIILILSLVAGPAYAAEQRPVDVLFLELKAIAGFDADHALLIESVILSELSKHKQLNVISKNDVTGMLDVEQLKQSMDCSQKSCMAEIAGALGTDFVVMGNLGKLGDDDSLLNLQWVSNKEARVIARVSVNLTASGAGLVGQVQEGVRELLAGYDPSFQLNANLQQAKAAPKLADKSSVWGSWWLWTGLAAVAGGVAAGVVLSSGGDSGMGTLQGSLEVGQ